MDRHNPIMGYANLKEIMKKYVIALLAALALTTSAQEAPKGPPKNDQRPLRPALTEQQKKLQTELLAKYDLNKDGKLDRAERQKLTPGDRKNMRTAGLGGPPDDRGGPRKGMGPRDGMGPRRDGTGRTNSVPVEPKP